MRRKLAHAVATAVSEAQEGGTTTGSLREVAGVFLRLGCTAYGGPAAHVGMMRREMVERRHWVTEQEFLDLFGAANLIPGPSSTELCILLGYRRAGWRALILAGALFILPAMVIVLAFAWAYVRFGTLPATTHMLYGVKPVIIAIIALALWGLRRTALKDWPYATVALGAGIMLLLGVNPLPLLLGGAAVLVVKVLGERAVKKGRSAHHLLFHHRTSRRNTSRGAGNGGLRLPSCP